jgi:hypothetical protein
VSDPIHFCVWIIKSDELFVPGADNAGARAGADNGGGARTSAGIILLIYIFYLTNGWSNFFCQM